MRFLLIAVLFLLFASCPKSQSASRPPPIVEYEPIDPSRDSVVVAVPNEPVVTVSPIKPHRAVLVPKEDETDPKLLNQVDQSLDSTHKALEAVRKHKHKRAAQ